MSFDLVDIVILEVNGQLFDLIFYEMGYVFGFGLNWGFFGLIMGVGGLNL